MYTPCVVRGARTLRVYSYTGCIYAVCSHGGEFSSSGLFRYEICIRCVDMGARIRQVY